MYEVIFKSVASTLYLVILLAGGALYCSAAYSPDVVITIPGWGSLVIVGVVMFTYAQLRIMAGSEGEKVDKMFAARAAEKTRGHQ